MLTIDQKRRKAVPVALGIVAGLAGALALSRLMDSLLYGVTPGDALTFFIAPPVLIVGRARPLWCRRAVPCGWIR